MGSGAHRASYRLASAVARAYGLPANLGVPAQPAPVDSRKPASAAQCFEFGCVIPCRLLGVVVVGSGSIPHGLRPLCGRVGSLLPPLPWLRGFARRAGNAIADDGQGLLPETPQGFF